MEYSNKADTASPTCRASRAHPHTEECRPYRVRQRHCGHLAVRLACDHALGWLTTILMLCLGGVECAHQVRS
jgi:hypothetical protein